MIQLIPIHFCRFRNTHRQRMMAGLDIFQRYLFRYHIRSGTPIRAGKIRRRQGFLYFFLRISLLGDIGSQTLSQPNPGSRIKTTERSAVRTPRNKIQDWNSINGNNILFFHELIPAGMTAMSRNDIFQTDITCALRNIKSNDTSFRANISGYSCPI